MPAPSTRKDVDLRWQSHVRSAVAAAGATHAVIEALNEHTLRVIEGPARDETQDDWLERTRLAAARLEEELERRADAVAAALDAPP